MQTNYHQLHAFTHPKNNAWGHLCNRLLNPNKLIKLRRALLPKLPYLQLESDTVNIVYLNWLVDLEAFSDLIPEGVQIPTKGKRAIFSILTYQHTHFGPIFAGAARKLFPSPLQSNWRFYLENITQKDQAQESQTSNKYTHLAPAHQGNTVLFVKNILNSILYTMGGRLLSDALPADLAQSFLHSYANQTYTTDIQAGCGSSPRLYCVAKECNNKKLPAELNDWFSGWDDALQYLCPQDSAIAFVDDIQRIAHAGITLPIDVTQAKPLQVEHLEIPFLERDGAHPSEPFAFVIPAVKLQVLWEHIL